MQQFSPVASPNTLATVGNSAKVKKVSFRSAFFSLSRAPARAGPAGEKLGIGTTEASTHLLMAVPKKLLKSSVKRNCVKRIARESWRAADSIIAKSGAGRLFLLKLMSLPKEATALSFKKVLRSDLDGLLRLASKELSN